MSFPPLMPLDNLRNVHPWVNNLFSARIVPNLPLVGRLKHFLEAWEILTKDPEILKFLKRIQCRRKLPRHPHIGLEQAGLIQVEIGNMLKKGAKTSD